MRSGIFALVLGVRAAHAYPWNSEPQPLLKYSPHSPSDSWTQDYVAILADAGSPLAWDDASKDLWYIVSGKLCRARWDQGAFKPKDFKVAIPKKEGGLAVDPAQHHVFYLDPDGFPTRLRGTESNASVDRLGNEPLTRILGVDPVKHWVFGYDANAGGIRKYEFNSKAKTWSSVLIATGLGSVGDSAGIDPLWHVLYTTHETVDSGIPRNPQATTASDPTGLGMIKPWPLVATALSGTKWNCQVLDETSVPQQPAVRTSTHQVFYARGDDLQGVHYYQPAFHLTPESFGSYPGWSGTDTYVDNSQYAIKKPYFPPAWSGGSGSGVIITSGGGGHNYGGRTSLGIQLQPPISVVAYYKPIWTESPLPPRLTRFRAVVNPAQNRLVQNRTVFTGESVRQQTGVELVGYFYRDANGVLTSRVNGSPISYYWAGHSYWEFQKYFPPLDASFDPANPPASFTYLSDTNSSVYTDYGDLRTDRATADPQTSPVDLPYYTTDPFTMMAPYLRPPAQVDLHTFGHRWSSNMVAQPGARYRTYSQYGTNYGVPSGIAVDMATGVTFYTQSADPALNEATAPVSSNPVVDPKLPAPTDAKVWIVMVY